MRKIRIILPAVAMALMGLAAVFAQPKIPVGTKEFMRQKLELAQKILEGLALEDYDQIIAKSKKLSAMSLDATWQAFQNPNYDQHSVNFRQAVDGITKAAQKKNLDGATRAYARMTTSCVECHKFVRGKLVASFPLTGSGRGIE
jgi:cytochrome c556